MSTAFNNKLQGMAVATMDNAEGSSRQVEKRSVRLPRLRDLPTVEQKPFDEWLVGQTRPMIEGVPMEEQDAYYEWDYKRWKEGRPIID